MVFIAAGLKSSSKSWNWHADLQGYFLLNLSNLNAARNFLNSSEAQFPAICVDLEFCNFHFNSTIKMSLRL